MVQLETDRAEQVDRIVASFAGQPGALLPILHGIQEALGFIPPQQVGRIAEGLNLSRAEVHGVISFYHYFRQTPPGRHVLQICRAEACQSVHGERTESHACKALGVDFNGTTADGVFTLEAAFCLGNCAAGPSAMIDGKIYGRVTPDRLDELLVEWRQR